MVGMYVRFRGSASDQISWIAYSSTLVRVRVDQIIRYPPVHRKKWKEGLIGYKNKIIQYSMYSWFRSQNNDRRKYINTLALD